MAYNADLRYSRLARYAPLGQALAHWQRATVAIAGLGGLGGSLALQLARFGTRRLLLIDRDVAGPENLGHQATITEQAVIERWPKAEAAAAAVRAVNSAVDVVPHCASLSYRSAADLLAGADIILDGLDNYSARFLLNDYALAAGVPYVYAGVVEGSLSVKAIVPGTASCLRCLLPQPPAPGEVPTCAQAGLFAPLLGVANAIQLELAGRILAGGFTADDDAVYSLKLPRWDIRRLPVAKRNGCPACNGSFEFLSGLRGGGADLACAPGSAEVQLDSPLALDAVQKRLPAGEFTVTRNAFCLVAEKAGAVFTMFPSGRVVLNGSSDPVELNRFVGTYLGV